MWVLFFNFFVTMFVIITISPVSLFYKTDGKINKEKINNLLFFLNIFGKSVLYVSLFKQRQAYIIIHIQSSIQDACIVFDQCKLMTMGRILTIPLDQYQCSSSICKGTYDELLSMFDPDMMSFFLLLMSMWSLSWFSQNWFVHLLPIQDIYYLGASSEVHFMKPNFVPQFFSKQWGAAWRSG